MGNPKGRKGRRNKDMIRTATERISVLFSLAERSALKGEPELADRYVFLAFTIAKRYNIRLEPWQKACFCRKCSSYLLVPSTASVRVRDRRVVRRCLRCGDIKRVPLLKNRSKK